MATDRRPVGITVLIGVVGVAIAAAVLLIPTLSNRVATPQADPTPSPAASSAPPSPDASLTASADPASPGSSATPSPTPVAGPFDVEWTAVEGLGSAPKVSAFVVSDDRWLAGGSDGLDAAIWFSDDEGRTWQPSAITTSRSQNEYMQVSEMHALDDGLVAVGAWGGLGSEQAVAVTWRSTDGGLTWSEHRAEAPQPAVRTSVAHGEDLLGFGWTYSGTLPFDSIVFASSDATTWTEAGPRFEGAQVNDAESSGERAVAVGMQFNDGGSPYSPMAWLSDDAGATWQPVELPLVDASGGDVRGVARMETGTLVAVGGSYRDVDGVIQSVPTAWISHDDGQSWQAEALSGDGVADAVAATERGLVAFGRTEAFNPGALMAWTSPTGADWTSTSSPGSTDAYPGAIAGLGTGVAIGSSCGYDKPCPPALVIGTFTDLD